MNDDSSAPLPPTRNESPAQRLERLWDRGQRPDVHQVLAATADLSPAVVAEALAVDQWRRWRAGEGVPAEEYLRRYPALEAEPDQALELIYGEFLVRRELGEAPEPEEYFRRFPRHAEPLRRQLEVSPLLDGEGESAASTVRGSGLGGSAGRRADGPALPVMPGYEVLGELGRGGMGVVYQAWQPGLGRMVALKMLLSGAHAGPDELARFRAEAEAVGRLQHPNIVPIYEIGEHDGRPYLALEFVEGGSLDHQLAGTPQPVREAAGLAETLARAVHYAHQRGIVHRDLKPANVLLSFSGRSQSGGGEAPLCERPLNETVPKITDFGLAKILVGGRGDPTRTGAVLGTPSYMAPEQASGKPREVGPAADVYALGAILYELLTGRPPFKAISALETLQQVVSDEPVPPSQLQPKVPRDLETVCLKCLRKEPPKRYASALDLADDLRRFLAGQPVRARPVGAAGRLWRWCRRRPAVASLTAALAAALLAGFGGVTGLWLRADASRQQADASRQLAEAKSADATAKFKLAREAADNYATRISDNLRLRQEDLRPLRKELLETVVPFYEKLIEGHSDDPEVQEERGWAYFRLGKITTEIDEKKKAAALFEQAVAIFDDLVRAHPDDPLYQKDLARACNDLGNTCYDLHDAARAERAYQRAVAVREGLAAKDPDDAENRCGLALHYNNLGNVYAVSQRRRDAEDVLSRARALLEPLARANPDNREYHDRLVSNHLARGVLYLRAREWPRAEESLETCRRLAADLVARYPSEGDAPKCLAVAFLDLGLLYAATNRPEKARESFSQALLRFEALARDNPSVLEYDDRRANCHIGLGKCHQRAGELPQAEKAYLRAVTLYEGRLASQDAALPNDRAQRAEAWKLLGGLYALRREWEKADNAYLKALDLLERLARQYPDVDDYYAILVNCATQILMSYRAAGEVARAEAACRRVVALGEQRLHDLPGAEQRRNALAFAYNILSDCYDAQGKPEAVGVQESALRLHEQLAEDFPGVTRYEAELGQSYVNLGLAYHQQRRWDDAEAVFQKALPVFERLAAAAGADLQYAAALGGCCGDMGLLMKDRNKGEEALKWYARAVPQLENVLKQDAHQAEAGQYLRNALWQRADLLVDLGRSSDALPDYDAAARLADGPALQQIRIARARPLALLGDHARAASEAQELATKPAVTAHDLYSLACVYSLGTQAALKDAALAAPERAKQADDYAARAVALLERAHKAGFKAGPLLGNLKKNHDLDPLRSRPTFQDLLTGLEKDAGK